MKKKLNFIVIMTDQQQGLMTKRMGFGADLTPFLDSLAEKGAWFDKAYTPCPLCTPARVSFLTGRFASSHRVMQNPWPWPENSRKPGSITAHPDDVFYERDLLDVLKKSGYQTALIGKNHSHRTSDEFDYSVVGNKLMLNDEKTAKESKKLHEWRKNGMAGAVKAGIESMKCCKTVSEGINYIENQNKRGNPFMLWLSIVEPHNPYMCPEPYYSMFDGDDFVLSHSAEEDIKNKNERWHVLNEMYNAGTSPQCDDTITRKEYATRTRKTYMGMIRMVDDQIKRFVTRLEELGMMEDTVICFTSDHGDMGGEYDMMGKGFGLLEALTNIQMIFAGGGIKIQGKLSEIHTNLVDIAPTLIEAAQCQIPDSMQGRSLWQILQGNDIPENEFESTYSEYGVGGSFHSMKYYREHKEELDKQNMHFDLHHVAVSGVMRMVRMGDYKLIFDFDNRAELYHVVLDPSEKQNLFGNQKYKKVQDLLMSELLKWCLRAQDPAVMRENHCMNPIDRLIDRHHYHKGTEYKQYDRYSPLTKGRADESYIHPSRKEADWL